jgi:putative NADH-flavin reductase
LLRNTDIDCTAMEALVTASDLDWTIARPPQLTDGPVTGTYAVRDGDLPNGKRTISRADVADFLIGTIERGEHIRSVVGMAG